MRFKLQLVTAPSVEPVSLSEAKLHLRVDVSDDDTLITSLIKSARLWCETQCGRAFISQQLRLSLDGFPADIGDFYDVETAILLARGCRILLPRPKLISVDSITHVDANGVTQTLDPSSYQADLEDEPGAVLPAVSGYWPVTQYGKVNAVQITYTAGYGPAASDVDERAKIAIKLLVAHWYENREAVLTGTVSKEIELGLERVLAQLWHGHIF